MEVWKDIPNYEGFYQISNYGTVKNKKNGAIRKGCINTSGYTYVGLNKNGKQKNYLLHRLVAMCFVENTYDLPEINHIDGDKNNNNAKNLEWTTRSLNVKHAYKMGLRIQAIENVRQSRNHGVRQIKNGETIAIYPSIKSASEKTGIAISNISHACRHSIVQNNGEINFCKKAGGYEWEYTDEEVFIMSEKERRIALVILVSLLNAKNHFENCLPMDENLKQEYIDVNNKLQSIGQIAKNEYGEIEITKYGRNFINILINEEF